MFGGRIKLPDDHAHRTREMLRHLPEELAAAETEERTPHAVDGQRENRTFGATGDELVALTKRQDAAVAGEAALGEDTDDLAGLEGFGRLLDGVLGLRLGHGDGPHRAGQEAHDALPLEAFPREEPDRTRRDHPDDQDVDVGHVVGDEQHAPLVRQVLRPLEADPIEALQEQPATGLHRAITERHRAMPAGRPPGERQQEDQQEEADDCGDRGGDHQQEPGERVKQGHASKLPSRRTGASRVLSG